MENIAVKIIYFFMDGCGWCRKFLPEWKLIKEKVNSKELIGFKTYEFESRELENNEQAIKIKKHITVAGFPTIAIKINDTYYKYEGDRTLYNIMSFIKNKINENLKLQSNILNNLEDILKEYKKENNTQEGGKQSNYKKKYHKYKKLYYQTLKH
jgi:hypothetical protein